MNQVKPQSISEPPLLILTSLTSGPKHGYALIQDIEAFSGAKLGPGTLYGAIARLEQRGLIEPTGDDGDRRRPYRITDAGSELVEVSTAHARRLVAEAEARAAAAAPAPPRRRKGLSGSPA